MIPDGWNDYERIGKQIHGTRFIACNVPLKEFVNLSGSIPEEKQLYPRLLITLLPKLGIVIDLTNTLKYYAPDELYNLGVEYEKIKVEGHQIPSNSNYFRFRDAVDKFLSENADNDKLIGVHCTHGLNRASYLVCRYMIEQMSVPPLEAIAKFEVARGHKMQRTNYTDQLKMFGRKTHLSLAIDTDRDKRTQTQPVFCITETSIKAYGRNKITNDSIDGNDRQRPQQVAFTGYVNVQRSDLIPDGRGGYFVHVQRKDINRINGNQPKQYPVHQPQFRPTQMPNHDKGKKRHRNDNGGNKAMHHQHRFDGIRPQLVDAPIAGGPKIRKHDPNLNAKRRMF